MPDAPTILFVTGRLAEPALRRTLAALAPTAGFTAEVAVLPITVAALLTTDWVGRKLTVPAGIDSVMLPGFCRGDIDTLATGFGVPVERGPKDLRDLPERFGKRRGRPENYGAFDIDILAEINHAPTLSLDAIMALARRHRVNGADVIDVGCDPGATWPGVGDAVRALRADGFRVSVDSFDPVEVEAALGAGAELVLSVNGSNVDHAEAWHRRYPAAEVVAIPDTPTDLASFDATVRKLVAWGVPHRLDPILEPIGFGFARSLARYAAVRDQYPEARMMMGVGNLTELTGVDSAGVNVLLAGFCQELGIRSVLTTEVANWARSSVRELDLARRLVFHAVTEGVPPKHLEPGLLMLRDKLLPDLGDAALAELAARVTDRNYRVVAERGEVHAINGLGHARGADPFAVFAELARRDPKLDVRHAFYLGYEMAKAVTALTLAKNYAQDQALEWGFLTVPEVSHRNPAVSRPGADDILPT